MAVIVVACQLGCQRNYSSNQLKPEQLGTPWEVFLVWPIWGRKTHSEARSFEVGRPALILGHSFWRQSTWQKLWLLARLPSFSLESLSICCSGIALMVLERASSDSNTDQRPAETTSLWTEQLTEFLAFQSGDSHCWTIQTAAYKSL